MTPALAGALAQRPYVGGWDVLFVDRIEPDTCVDDHGLPASFGASANLRYLERVMNLGEGLVTFSTLAEAVAGVQEIVWDYARHAAAAREIAVEYFAADRVLPRLLEALGVA